MQRPVDKILIGNYHLVAMNYEKEATDLSYKLSSGDYSGVVDPTVFEVGYNKTFIITGQHPRKFPNPSDKFVTNYFIVPIENRVHQSPDENKTGPLTEIEFLQKRKELRVPDSLAFSRVIKELE